ncbi:hypothetical protein PMAYCL1PPCAC_04274, partial [Pristionchus mayeri]
RKKRSRPATPEAEAGNSSKPESRLIGIVALVALAIVPFALSIDGEFVFDDRKTIVENGVVRGTKPLVEVFTTDYWGDPLAAKISHKSYRPLTTLTFWLNHQLHDLWTPGYHVVNLLLHAINTLLVHRLATVVSRIIAPGLPGYGAWAAAAAFAVHPVHVEAVANVSGRAELLSGLFYLAAVLLYLGNAPNLGTVSRNSIYAILVVLSVGSKEQGITAPIVCVALEWALNGRKLEMRRTAANALLVATITIIRLWLNDWSPPRFSPHDNPAAFLPTALLRAVNYSHYWYYSLTLLLLPSSLCFDYSMGCFPPILSLTDYRTLSTVALICTGITVLGAIITAGERIKRWLLSLILLTVVPFLPASNLLVTVGFTVAERVLYLPSIGVCLLLPAAIDTIRNRISIDKSIKSLGWTFLIIASAMSAQRSYEWRSSLTLFSKDLAVCPNNAKINYNLGKVLADSGAFEEAEARYREALRLHPAYESALNNLGNLLEARGRTSDAEEYLKEAIRVAPSFAAAWMNLGIAQMRAGKYNMSEASLAHSVALRPGSAEAHFNLGVLQLRVGKQMDARAAWLQATSLDPAHARAWSNLFVLLDELEQCDEVIDLSHSALLHNAHLASLRLSIGTCYAKLGDFIEAERELWRAIELSPSTAIYHANLGVLYQRWHRYEEAVRTYSAALDLDPGAASIRENLETTRRRMNQTRN